jgi:hypothetical protein
MSNLMSINQRRMADAMQGFSDVSQMQDQRSLANKQMKMQEDQGRKSNIATGAGMGLMYGMQAGSVGGPVGMAIGAGIGLLVSELF